MQTAFPGKKNETDYRKRKYHYYFNPIELTGELSMLWQISARHPSSVSTSGAISSENRIAPSAPGTFQALLSDAFSGAFIIMESI